MTGGASLWRANWSANEDPFAHLQAAQGQRASTRGPGFQRAVAASGYTSFADRVAESTNQFRSKNSPAHIERSRDASGPKETTASAVSLGNPGRSDVSVGQRVFHSKFGYGIVAEIEGNKLEIDFEHSGRKRVLDSFVSVG
jgi:DNA helicase-2/ATP-dependent DNA helicase PcrA